VFGDVGFELQRLEKAPTGKRIAGNLSWRSGLESSEPF